MKKTLTLLAALSMTSPAYAGCQQYSVIGGRFDHQANIRNAPSFNSSVTAILWGDGYGGTPGRLTWCGRAARAGGTVWYFVGFSTASHGQQSGWVAESMVSAYNGSPEHPYGGTGAAAGAASESTNQNLNQNQNVINNYIVVPRQPWE
jgi:hypothetical protein